MASYFEDPAQSKAAQLEFVAFLKQRAKDFYGQNNQPKPAFTAHLRYQKLTADEIFYETMGEVSREQTEWLLDKKITEFARLKKSGSGIILAVRTDDDENGILKVRYSELKLACFDTPRIQHPAVFQPTSHGSFRRGKSSTDLFPFICVSGISDANEYMDVRDARTSILKEMYEIAGLKLAKTGVKNDLGILPDGTPVPVDPDILSFAQGPLSLEENIRHMQAVLEQFPYMAPVAWIENGKPKQDKFFGADYLTGVSPAVPVSKLDGNSRGGQKPALGSPAQG